MSEPNRNTAFAKQLLWLLAIVAACAIGVTAVFVDVGTGLMVGLVALAGGALAIAHRLSVRVQALSRHLEQAKTALANQDQSAALQRAAKAEAESNNLLQRLTLAMNAAGISMWEWNLKSDQCRVMPGTAFTERLGGRTEFLGLEYPDMIVHPDDRAGWVPYFTAAMSQPPGQDLFSHRYRAVYPDGSVHWIQFHGRIKRNAAGLPREVVAVDWDVTKEVEAAAEIAAQARQIAEAEARLLRAVAGTQDALFDLNIDNAKSWIAPRFYDILGYDANEFEITAKWWNSLVHPDDQARRAQALQAHLEGNGPFDIEYRLRRKDQSWIWVRARGVASAERDPQGRPIQFSGAIQDITEERNARERLIAATQAAEAASRAKSAFLATMSHEIRTPMNGIMGMTTLLLDSPLNGVQRDYAETVLSSADSLLKILNDILDFSKIEAGKLEIEAIEMDLIATVEDIASLMGFQCAAKNLELIVDIRPELPAWVIGDPQRLRQCLLNLVGNAIKFTQTGEVLIDVFPLGQQDGKTLIQFEVRDTGLGIEPHALQALFQPFTQADSSTTRRYGGTGLGLSIVRRLIELMGGKVGAQSEPGKGSVFWFTVPLQLATTASADDKIEEIPPSGVVPSGHRVLLVDDNETNRRVLSGQLRQAGYAVECAASGQEALATMRNREHLPFDLVLLDFEMPEMDGVMLGEKIMADFTLANTRLVMLTSLDRSGDMQPFSDIGFAAYLAKPIRNRELLRCLRKVLGYEATAWQSRSRPMVTRGNLLGSDGCAYQGQVLLVEDNVINQRVASRFLERLGCQVEIADDGVKAVAAFDRNRYGLILMDMQMPQMDGVEATRRIRASEARKGAARTPIVALTANALTAQMELCLEAGMDDYLTKPLDIDRLHGMLDRYLGTPNKPPALPAPIASNDSSVPAAFAAQISLRLREVSGNDVEFARELVHAYLGSSAAIVAEMRKALAANDLRMLSHAAHKLRGASSNLQLDNIAALSSNIEAKAKTGEQRDWQSELETVARELERSGAMLRQAIEPAASPSSFGKRSA